MSATIRSLPALTLSCACMLVAPEVRAQISVEVQPVFGEGCTPRIGPTEVLVGITNGSPTAASGTVRVEYVSAVEPPGVRTIPTVPFSVSARGQVTVHVQTPPAGLASGDAHLRVIDGAGRVVADRPLAYQRSAESMLIDATPQGRLAFALRAASTSNPYDTAPVAPVAAAAAGLTSCPALHVPQTGEVVLPRTLAGYGGVAMVLLDASTLMSLPLAERVTLADYVLTGGTLAVIPNRADELRHPTLAALLGSGIRGVTPPPLAPPTGTWLSSWAPGSFPQANTLQSVQSYQGGNLHYRTLSAMFPWGAPNLLGASAEYGRGHVHVLSFNPAMPPALEDPWAVALVARLAQQSNATRPQNVVNDASAFARAPAAVRRVLDPNEGFRSGLGYAAALLVLYAVLAGPVAFRHFARRQRPLRGLAMLPLWSAMAFGGVVTLGVLSRGWQGRVRRLAVIELPAGMPRGALRRYHGYYSGESSVRLIRARGLDRRLYADPNSGSGYVTLSMERDRSTLQGLATTPWTTAIVREEGMETLAGSVSIQPDPMGQLRVVNRMPHALREVIVMAPGGTQAWSFVEIPAGRTVLANSGTPVPPSALAALSGSTGSLPVFAGSASGTGTGGEGVSGPGWQIAPLFGSGAESAARWEAVLASASGIGAPVASEPVVLGMLAVPPPEVNDGDLRVEEEMVFVRVTGWGGAT